LAPIIISFGSAFERSIVRRVREANGP